MTQPRILLLTTMTADINSDSISPSLGLLRLQREARRLGFECDIFDHITDHVEPLLSRLQEGYYEIFGFSVTHMFMKNDLNFLWKVKLFTKNMHRRPLFMAGGQSATQNTQVWLECGFDLVVQGYAEKSFPQICERYASGANGAPWKVYGDILGVAYLDHSGTLVRNPVTPFTKDEFEAFSTVTDINVPYEIYWNMVRSNTTEALTYNQRSFVVENGRLYTSSRCLAHCGYCASGESFLRISQNGQAPFFMLSAEQIHEQMVHQVASYGVRSFSFNDEDFLVGNRVGIRRIMDLCHTIIQSKKNGILPKELKLSCQTRPNNFLIDKAKDRRVNRKLLQVMLDAGFHNVSLGIETFSDRLLNCRSINKPYIRSEEIHQVLHTIFDVGLFPTINLILGIPESTTDDLIETASYGLMYLQKPCQISSNIPMFAFPGAPIWGNDLYPTADTIWVHPESSRIVNIPFRYQIHDPKAAAILEQLEGCCRTELESIQRMHGMNSNLVVRTLKTIATFSAIAKLTGHNSLSKQCEAIQATL
ncbi:MAG: radical SAM protein [Magnetococcales bacterium]|nr:radical SAM protein [Magnetococcales bacterium]